MSGVKVPRLAWQWDSHWENQGGDPVEAEGFCVLYPEDNGNEDETVAILIGSFGDEGEREKATANAQRLAASWNACLHIPTSDLESGKVVGVDAERLALLEAFVTTAREFQQANKGDNIDRWCKARDAFESALAAVSRISTPQPPEKDSCPYTREEE